jgi:hypothetical protein
MLKEIKFGSLQVANDRKSHINNTVSSVIAFVPLTWAGYNTIDEKANAVCITRAFR